MSQLHKGNIIKALIYIKHKLAVKHY